MLGWISCCTSLQPMVGHTLRSVAPQGEYPARVTVNNLGFLHPRAGVWIPEQDFGRVLGLLRLERSRLLPGSERFNPPCPLAVPIPAACSTFPLSPTHPDTSPGHKRPGRVVPAGIWRQPAWLGQTHCPALLLILTATTNPTVPAGAVPSHPGAASTAGSRANIWAAPLAAS